VLDSEDVPLVDGLLWSMTRTGYAFNSKHSLYMHRLILGVSDRRIYVDHINRDKLDNRKSNLVTCSSQENQRNCSSTRGSTSRFKGVSWDKNRNKWSAVITVHRKLIHLGRFENEIEAAIAYDKAAREHGWPEYGLNFPNYEGGDAI
jgi:hypothetical protein